jgi:hypothetical protein
MRGKGPSGDERKLQILPLIAGALAGFFFGRVVGIGGLAGLLIGTFLVDAFSDLQLTRGVASELRYLLSKLSEWVRASRPGDEDSPAHPSEQRQEHP